MTAALDPRLNAYRADLADLELKGRVEAPRYQEGEVAQVIAHFADVLEEPRADAGLQTQILYGHEVRVFDRSNGWAWVQRSGDGYVGYVRDDLLSTALSSPTHMVLAPRTFLYAEADLKTPRRGYRSMGSRLEVIGSATTRGTDYCLLKTGEAVISRHLIPLDSWCDDFVAVAETLLHTPYLWGGDTGFGLDCSGLIFLSNMLCGKTVLRDSYMLVASVGQEIPFNEADLERGDLIFWGGHVGIMTNNDNLLHANGHTMDVSEEPLRQAVERIGYLYGQPTAARRPG